MTIHDKKVKKNLKLSIVAVCLFLSIFISMSSSNRIWKTDKNATENKGNSNKSTEIKGEEQVAANTKLTKIAFEKNNNVYLYDETNEQIKSIGDKLKWKDLLSISPDKTKIVFRYFNSEKAIYPPHVIVYDIKTESLTDIVINNTNLQQIIALKWIDNENVLVTGHINPSVSGYAVYSIESKQEIIACLGTLRDIIIDKKNILYSNTPHIFPKPKANLYVNGNKIFETIDVKEEIYDGVISKDGKMLAFRSYVENEVNSNGEATGYLSLAKVNSDGKSISDLKKITISGDTNGEMKFDNENNVSIVGNQFIYKLKSGSLIKEENTLPKIPELSTQQLTKFKKVLAKQFPEDVISEETVLEDIDVYNMEAF
ncbi:hypothetical protein K9O30_05805 [Clostridium bowmanii]|uniref:hypothetical protein n=1 Tax=Clostridium bowmanii TaxID=132925 RepID=UPI001C0BE02D|nr:hypothetical protein [Clostridium bowmanii]MBU3188674.1 hypothetical protein [Clostridium bowmanii]MCA1073259.1 hypothetical protein [Clostridium bowmanii]